MRAHLKRIKKETKYEYIYCNVAGLLLFISAVIILQICDDIIDSLELSPMQITVSKSSHKFTGTLPGTRLRLYTPRSALIVLHQSLQPA